jgi:hypothetical protein
MSLATWKSEFYPVEAKDVPEADALDHSIRKWEGLTTENIVKHHMTVGYGRIISSRGGEFTIDGESCALCAVYFSETNKCRPCPLVSVRGVSCDNEGEGEDNSPFNHFLEYNDPIPMLNLLKKAKEAQGE